MGAIFNGTTSVLSVADPLVDASPTYPVLVGGWAKLAAVTTNYGFVCLTDGAASEDVLYCECSGAVASDPVRAMAAVNAVYTTSINSTNGLTAGSWLFVGAYFGSNTNRQPILGTTVGANTNATARAVASLSAAYIGAFRDSATSTFFSGRIAEVFVAQGFTAGDLTTIVTQLAGGASPSNVAELSPHLVAYQPLISALDNSGAVGPSWTNTDVTFDSADHPISYSAAGDAFGCGFDFGFGF